MVKPIKGYAFEWTSKGGNNESSIGANCHIYNFKHPENKKGERDEDMAIIDMGAGSGDYGTWGYHRILPDLLSDDTLEKADKIFLTHAHSDHMEAIFYYIVSPLMTARGGLEMGAKLPPIFSTPYTIEVTIQYLTTRLGRILASKDISDEIKEDMRDRFNSVVENMSIIYPGQTIRVGKSMDVTAVAMSHSTLHTIGFKIKTPTTTVFHSADFNTDQTYLQPCFTDMDELKEMGDEGVDFALIDSTGADKNQSVVREETVRTNLIELIEKHKDKRAVIPIMGGHDQRLFSIIDVARKTGREIFVAGNSMRLKFDLFSQLGLLPADVKINYITRAGQENRVPRDKAIVITTGSQGERKTPLVRALMEPSYKTMTLDPKHDVVIFSSSMLGINKARYTPVINKLKEKNFSFYHKGNYNKALNASGHARAPGIKRVLEALRPKYGIPMHGMLQGRAEGRKKGLLHYCADIMSGLGIRPIIVKNSQTVQLDHADGPKIVKDNSKNHTWLAVQVFSNVQSWVELYMVSRQTPTPKNEREKKDRYNIGRSFDHTI